MNMPVRHPDEVLTPAQGGADHRFDAFRFGRAVGMIEAEMGAKWLDLGCHKGEFLSFLGPGINRYGADCWTDDLPGPWVYQKCNFEKSFPKFLYPMDVVSCFEVLEHITDTEAFLHGIYATLRPGGWVLLSTPNINSLRNRVTVPLGAYPYGLEWRNVIHHVRLYNPTALRQQLAGIGFENISCKGISFLPLSSPWGIGWLSCKLADWFPSLCNNFFMIAQKP